MNVFQGRDEHPAKKNGILHTSTGVPVRYRIYGALLVHLSCPFCLYDTYYCTVDLVVNFKLLQILRDNKRPVS